MEKKNLMQMRTTNAIKKLNDYFATIAKHIRRLDVRKMNKTADGMYRFCKNTSRIILPNKNMILCRFVPIFSSYIEHSHLNREIIKLSTNSENVIFVNGIQFPSFQFEFLIFLSTSPLNVDEFPQFNISDYTNCQEMVHYSLIDSYQV